MLLESFITTIPAPAARPVKIAELGFRAGCKVELPFADLPLCSGITLDMHEPIVDELFEIDGSGVKIRDKTLEVGLKVYYRQQPLFHGPLHAPEFDYATGKITLAAGMVPRLQLACAHAATTVALDGEGLLALLDLAQNTDAEDAAGDPVLGVIRGKDTTTDSASTRTLNAGDGLYQSIKDIQGLVIGPDFRIVAFEDDPAELASGPVFANYFGAAADIADNAVTDFPLDVVLPGLIGGLKLGVWVEHTRPGEVNIDLVHPDGSSVRVYTGSKEKTAASATGDFLGQGTGPDACYFYVSHPTPYGVAYPKVGIFRPDRSLNSFLDKPAAGTWKLRVHDTAAGHTGTVAHFWLGFELPSPAFCRMDVADKPDSAALPAPSCTFMKGHGSDSARVLKVKPQGDLTRNYFTAKSKAGGTATRKSLASMLAYGRYEGFEAGSENDAAAVLRAFADNEVLAYSRPLPMLEIAPKDDGGQDGVLRYGTNFIEGSYVRAIGKKGRSFHQLLARIAKVTLTNQADQNGSAVVRCDTDVVPAIGAASEISDA